MGESPPPTPPPPAAPAKVYYEGCPGCAMERRKESSTGTPYKELFFVGITTFASSLPITSLFPFLYFMIQDLHVAQREEDIGFYAGFLGASYMVGRGFASIFWGMVADRIGRKPVIVFSLFTVIVFNTLFGLSVKYWMAITTRLLLGALNGFLAPIKVNTAWGLGLIIGPAIGGYLAQPAKQYPHIFHDKSTFGRFPYLLPCLCISIFATFALISCIWLPETLHKHAKFEMRAETAEAGTTQESTESPKKSLWKNWPLMSSIITYCVFSLHDTAYSEIFSLWTVSGRKYGGLSFSSKDVGQVLTVAGVSLLVYQIFVYRWLNNTLGPVNSTRIASALSIPIIAAYPFMTRLSGIRLGLALYIAAMIKSVLAPQGQRGAANGIATTLMSLFKSVAPAGAGILFSWAQKRQHAAFFPGDQMVFLLLNVTEVLGLLLTFKPFLAVPQHYNQATEKKPPYNEFTIVGDIRTSAHGSLLVSSSIAETNETSADVPAYEASGGKACGAFSSAVQSVLAAHQAPLSNRELVAKARAVLEEQGFEQHPCLYCTDANAEAPFLSQDKKEETAVGAASPAMSPALL
ncbi:Protein ZINC INDUCED FACILITATOR-LIKE 1 [Triticum urartu]|uniref:Protein ZINC INDUCED FACILITATOR-LIKE 1 n=1 Tax=Triticum urartu TaxID=4572 RepID=M8ARM5_TRIUA|nr:Protein ZINC INDUCED FACILITATOR-LIKE 1 [Triticum urartu]